MDLNDVWDTLGDRVEELPTDSALLTPLSRKRFTVTEIRDSKMIIEYRTGAKSDSLRREKFELLLSRVLDAPSGFDYDRLPPNAEPYATVLSLHPRVHFDDGEGTITEAERPSTSPLVDIEETPDSAGCTDQAKGGKAVSLGEMLSKMGTSQNTIECPITGCSYSSRSAESVAAHVSASSTAKHIWANTSYASFRDFIRKHE